jgi:hypothetical protein
MKHIGSINETSRLMVCKKIIHVHSEGHTKHKHPLWEKCEFFKYKLKWYICSSED